MPPISAPGCVQYSRTQIEYSAICRSRSVTGGAAGAGEIDDGEAAVGTAAGLEDAARGRQFAQKRRGLAVVTQTCRKTALEARENLTQAFDRVGDRPVARRVC